MKALLLRAVQHTCLVHTHLSAAMIGCASETLIPAGNTHQPCRHLLSNSSTSLRSCHTNKKYSKHRHAVFCRLAQAAAAHQR